MVVIASDLDDPNKCITVNWSILLHKDRPLTTVRFSV